MRSLKPSVSLFCLAFALGACGNGDADDSTSSDNDTEDTDADDDTESDDGPDLVCIPGETRCADDETLEICAPTGLEWEQNACSEYSACVGCEEDEMNCTAACLGPCDSEDELPSSAGCSFIANRMIHPNEDEVDGLIVGNPNSTQTATITLFEIPDGQSKEEVLEGPYELAPGEDQVFELAANFIDLQGFSRFRTGGNYRLQSDIPVIAYLHSPWRSTQANDASMLLPERALRTDYVVTSYTPETDPSYFTIIAVEDDTEVEWTPRLTGTIGNGFPIDPVNKGQTGKLTMLRFDNARIAASQSSPNPEVRDVSGTVIKSSKPIWVVGAVNCAEVPPGKQGCDYLQEALLPIDYWGREYVAAPAPARADEPYFWRVYAGGKDGTTITASPPVIEPIVLSERGDFVEFSVAGDQPFTLEADGPFMPVQYLAGRQLASKIGDPSMYQMVPVEQFLQRYVFVTGLDYDENYVQVIRHAGGADVFVDDALVTGYYTIGDFEVSDWLVDEGAHTAESTEDFGIVQIGYTTGADPNGRASYAYPGGMKVEQVYIP